MVPLLVLCALWPVYMLNAFKPWVSLAHVLLLVMGFSAEHLVPTASGLVIQLVIGWPAAA